MSDVRRPSRACSRPRQRFHRDRSASASTDIGAGRGCDPGMAVSAASSRVADRSLNSWGR
jgi:hypothetical protein